jgi:hypothetical protein
MNEIPGGARRWLLAAGGVVLVAAAGCQSTPHPGVAAPATAPAITQPAPANGAPANGAPAGGEPADRTSSTPTGAPTTSRPTPPPRCHTADLSLEVGEADSGMGHTGLNLALINRSTHSCRIYGYGGIQLLDANGAARPTHQDRGRPAPTLTTLRPGDRAYSVLTWLSTSDALPCYAASFVLVIPPDETQQIRAPFRHQVCGNGVLSQGPYQSTPV